MQRCTVSRVSCIIVQYSPFTFNKRLRDAETTAFGWRISVFDRPVHSFPQVVHQLGRVRLLLSSTGRHGRDLRGRLVIAGLSSRDAGSPLPTGVESLALNKAVPNRGLRLRVFLRSDQSRGVNQTAVKGTYEIKCVLSV
jgi:hypothetical protein